MRIRWTFGSVAGVASLWLCSLFAAFHRNNKPPRSESPESAFPRPHYLRQIMGLRFFED